LLLSTTVPLHIDSTIHHISPLLTLHDLHIGSLHPPHLYCKQQLQCI